MTGDAVVVLARLEHDARFKLAVEDFAGRFWGHGPDTIDVAGTTGTLDFPRVIMLSIKAEERRKNRMKLTRQDFVTKQ